MTKERMNLETEQHVLECAVARAIGQHNVRDAERFKQQLAEVKRQLGRVAA